MMKVNNKKIKKKQNIELRFYPKPYPGETYITFMYVDDKKVGGILYNQMELQNKPVCLILNIVVDKKHRRNGYAYKCLMAFLPGFDRVDTQIDSKAGLNLILKAGFRTANGKTYIWEKKEKKSESKKIISD